MRTVAMLMGSACRLHDGLTRATFLLACLGTAYLTAVTALEVLQRYFLRSPSAWTADTAALAFAAIVFLAMPQVTRARGHVSMTFLLDTLGPAARRAAEAAIGLVAAAICLLCGLRGLQDLLRHADQGVMIIAVTPIPRWWVTAAIAYGLLSMGTHFLRQGLASAAGRRGGEATP